MSRPSRVSGLSADAACQQFTRFVGGWCCESRAKRKGQKITGLGFGRRLSTHSFVADCAILEAEPERRVWSEPDLPRDERKVRS